MMRHRPARRVVWGLAVATFTAGTLALPARAEMPEAQRKSVEAGVAWLLKHQRADGGFQGLARGDDGRGGHVGITAIAGLALLATGSTPDQGDHAAAIGKVIDFLLARADAATGLLATPGEASPMYGHGFALLFLSEAYATGRGDELKAKLRPVIEKAIALSEKAQNRDGWWRYRPDPLDAYVSVTAGQLNALHAARRAGFKVDDQVLARGLRYVERCRNDDGGYAYVAAQRSGSGPARSAAALAVQLHVAGAKADDPAPQATQTYLARAGGGAGGAGGAGEAAPAPGEAGRARTEPYYFYRAYYTALAAARAEGLAGPQRRTAEEIVRRQDAQGRWSGEVTDDYATAMAVLSLQLPHRPLPAFKEE